MPSKSTTNRIFCVLYTQIFFFGGLVCMGFILIIGSIVNISHAYWSCAVLNIYYTVSWLCLSTGIVQVLLGIGLGLFIYLQPHCTKKDHLVLVGPEGNRLGEIEAEGVRNSNNNYWTLQLSPEHQKSRNRGRSHRSQCTCFHCCHTNNENSSSVFDNITLWLRPSAVVFLLLVAAHIAAISLTASLITEAQREDIGLSSEVENIFIEAKSVFMKNDASVGSSAAAKCWERLESKRRCCGFEGPADWLLEDSTISKPDFQFELLRRQCSCSKLELGICETQTFNISVNSIEIINVYTRGCRGVIHGDILHDLQVFRVLTPISFCVILLTCFICVCVTLRVAYLEMGNEDDLFQNVENSSIGHMQTDSLQRSFMSVPPNPPPTPNPLSKVTGPALRSLSLDAAMHLDGSLIKPK